MTASFNVSEGLERHLHGRRLRLSASPKSNRARSGKVAAELHDQRIVEPVASENA